MCSQKRVGAEAGGDDDTVEKTGKRRGPESNEEDAGSTGTDPRVAFSSEPSISRTAAASRSDTAAEEPTAQPARSPADAAHVTFAAVVRSTAVRAPYPQSLDPTQPENRFERRTSRMLARHAVFFASMRERRSARTDGRPQEAWSVMGGA